MLRLPDRWVAAGRHPRFRWSLVSLALGLLAAAGAGFFTPPSAF